MRFRVIRSDEFEEWLSEQTFKTRTQVRSRLSRIEDEGHFGFINAFDGLVELKWASGLRVYTARVGNELILILLGGNKNGQEKDIKKAKSILARLQRMEI